MFLHTLIQVSTCEADIICITQTALVIINNIWVINNYRLYSFGLNCPLIGWTAAFILRLRSQRCCLTEFADFWSLNGKTILMGASCSSRTFCLEHTLSARNFSFSEFCQAFLESDYWTEQCSFRYRLKNGKKVEMRSQLR